MPPSDARFLSPTSGMIVHHPHSPFVCLLAPPSWPHHPLPLHHKISALFSRFGPSSPLHYYNPPPPFHTSPLPDPPFKPPRPPFEENSPSPPANNFVEGLWCTVVKDLLSYGGCGQTWAKLENF